MAEEVGLTLKREFGSKSLACFNAVATNPCLVQEMILNYKGEKQASEGQKPESINLSDGAITVSVAFFVSLKNALGEYPINLKITSSNYDLSKLGCIEGKILQSRCFEFIPPDGYVDPNQHVDFRDKNRKRREFDGSILKDEKPFWQAVRDAFF